MSNKKIFEKISKKIPSKKILVSIIFILVVILISVITLYSTRARYIPREIIRLTSNATKNYEEHSKFLKFLEENPAQYGKVKKISPDIIKFWSNYKIKIDGNKGSCTNLGAQISFDYDNDGDFEIFDQCDFEKTINPDDENFYQVFFEKDKKEKFHVGNISAGFPKFHVSYKGKNYIISEIKSDDTLLTGFSIQLFSENELLEEVFVKKANSYYSKPEINFLESKKYKPFAQEISKRLVSVNDKIYYVNQPKDYFTDELFKNNRVNITRSRFHIGEWEIMDTDISHNWFEKFGDEIYFVIWGQDIFRNYFAHIFLVENKKIGKKIAEISLNEISKPDLTVRHSKKSFEIIKN